MKKTNSDFDIKQFSRKIVTALGGWKNIRRFNVCATRIKVAVIDYKKVDEKALKNLAEQPNSILSGSFFLKGQIHLVLGAYNVNKLANCLINVSIPSEEDSLETAFTYIRRGFEILFGL